MDVDVVDKIMPSKHDEAALGRSIFLSLDLFSGAFLRAPLPLFPAHPLTYSHISNNSIHR